MGADGSLVFDTKVNAEGFKGAMASLEGAANKAFKGIAAGVAAVSGSLGTIGGIAIKVGADFESSMAKTSTLFGNVNVDTQSLNAQVLELSASTGLAASQIGESLYNALSAGIPATEDMGGAMLYMEQNSKLARAGFTDIDTAVTATAKVLNAYGMDVSETERVHKVLMQTQNKGITTVGQLGASLAQVTPIAAAMNVGFEQVGAALANMTGAGTETSVAITQLRSLLAELGKQGTSAQKALEAAAEGTEYAGMSFQEMMEAGVPLNEVLGLMKGYADESGKSFIDLFGSIEAGNAALSISGENAQKFTENLTAMSTEADVVGEAYERVTDTLEVQAQMALESLKNLGISFYQDVETPMKKAVETISRTLNSSAFQASFQRLSKSFGELAEDAARLAQKALPVLVEALAFLSEHLGGIVRAAGAAYAAFKTFEIVKSVGTWLSGASKAVDLAKKSVVELTLANGAAAAGQAALNGQLTLGQLAAGVLTGKIELAAAAAAVWNAVASANPWVLLASAVAACAVGIGIYIATQQKASESTQALIDETDALLAKGEDLNESIRRGAEQRDAEAESMEAEAGAAQVLSGRLYELAGKTNKTAAEKAQMAVLVDQLNEKIPELGLALDAETGALNKQKDAVDEAVRANLELAKAAAARKQAMAAAEDLTKAEMQLRDYTEQVVKLVEEMGRASGASTSGVADAILELAAAGDESSESVEKARGVVNRFLVDTMNAAPGVNELGEQLVQLQEQIGQTGQSVTDCTDRFNRYSEYAGEYQAAAEQQAAALEGVGDAADTASDGLQGMGDTAQSAQERFTAAMESVGISAEEAAGKITETMDSARTAATDAFEKIEQKSKLSVDQMIANLEANQQAVGQWGTNLKTLAERGVDEGLLATLREAGPEMAAQTQALVDASDEKLQKLVDVYRSSMETAAQAGADAVESQTIAITGKLEALPEQAGSAVSGTSEAVAGQLSGDAPTAAALQQVEQTAAAYAQLGPKAAETVAANPPDFAGPLEQSVQQGVDSAGQAFEGLAPAVQGPTQQAAQLPAQELQAAVPETQAAAEANKAAIVETMGQAGSQIQTALEPAAAVITEFSESVKTAGNEGFTTFSETAKTQMEAMAKAVADQTGAASETLKQWFGVIQKQTDKETAEFVSKTEKQLKKMPDKFKTVGKESVKGIWKGMQAEQGWLDRQVAALVDSTVRAAKAAADIHSPSRRMAQEVGQPLAEGIAKGVEEKMPEVSAQINGWVSDLIGEFGEEALKNIGFTADAISERLGGIYDTVKDHATNAFSTIKEADELSVQDLIHNLEDNQRAIEDWADNLRRAADRGLDEGLLQKLREAGPEMNNTLENIVNASDREFERLNDQCAASGETIRTAFGGIFESLEPGMREAIERAIAEYEKMPDEAGKAASGTGSSVASGISSGSGEVSSAAAGIGAQVAAGISSGTEEASSAAQGLMSAVSTSLSGASESVRQAGAEAATAFAQGVKTQLEASPIDFSAAVAAANNDALAKAAKAAGGDVSKSLTEGVAAKLEETPVNFTEGVKAAGNETLYNAVRDIGGKAAAALTASIDKQLTESPPDFGTALETAGGAAMDVADAVFAQLPLRIMPHLEAARVKLTEWFAAVGRLIEERTRTFHDTVSAALERMSGTLEERLRDALEAARQWFAGLAREAGEWMPRFTGAVLSPLERLPGEFESVGARMAEGLWDGMDSMRGWLESQIEDFVDGLVDAARQAADIHSPSRRMARGVGAPLAAGVGQGFQDETPRVARGMRADLNALIRRMEEGVAAESARYGQKAAVMQANSSAVNQSAASGGINITIHWSGGGDDVDLDRLGRHLGRRVAQQLRAKGGGVL